MTFYDNAAIDTEWEALRNFRGVAVGDTVRFALPKREPLLVEHERLRDAVEGKDSNFATLRQGLRTVEVCAAILASTPTALPWTAPPDHVAAVAAGGGGTG